MMMSGISMYKSNNVMANKESMDKSQEMIVGMDNDMSFITLSDYMENAIENCLLQPDFEITNAPIETQKN